MERHGLTNEQWEKIRPFLPEQNRGRGRRWLDLRTSVNGILWILGTGATMAGLARTVREVEIGLKSLRKVAVGKGLGQYSRRTL